MNKVIFIIFLTLMTNSKNSISQYEEYERSVLINADYERIATEDYNAVFLSTYPIGYYVENDVSDDDGSLLMTYYCIPDMKTLYEYCIQVSGSGNNVDTIYLAVRPDIITADELLNLLRIWEDKHFEIIMAYPSLEYWRGLDEEEYPAVIASYTDFVNTLMSYYKDSRWLQSHISLYFYNSTEWLVGNNTNYENYFKVNEGIAHDLSMYADSNPGYQLTLENYTEELAKFEALVSDCRTEAVSAYPDLAEWDVVFFGDSVIAFTETSSIPSVFSGFTGAHIYNCGKGGCRASAMDNYDEYPGFPIIVDAFLAEDLSLFSKDSQIYAGMTDYFEYSDQNRQQCFMINFGLNDYFMGRPVRNNDPYDIYTYEGALRTAIEKLQGAYPNAVIILLTPNYTSLFENGLQPLSDAGGQLPDYVAAVISICDEKGLPFYDSYNLLGINSDNYTQYLQDGCHPNETTRYTMAQGLAELIGTIAEGGEQ